MYNSISLEMESGVHIIKIKYGFHVSKEKEAERYYMDEGMGSGGLFFVRKETNKRQLRRFVYLIYL